MSSPSLAAIGLDPRTATFHVLIKTERGEFKRKLPLGPDTRLVFDLFKGMVARYL